MRLVSRTVPGSRHLCLASSPDERGGTWRQSADALTWQRVGVETSLIPVVDVFAGPGGLNEGFSRVERGGNRVFDIAASFEMEKSAVNTLRLRSAVRELSDGPKTLYQPYLDVLNAEAHIERFLALPEVAAALNRADMHVRQVELGPHTRDESDAIIRRVLTENSPWVLIGGPPCQAYSLVGRARRAHDPTFVEDKKHFLYREYLHIIETFQPSVFVMENVKGLLSAGHGGRGMFQRIMEDLSVDGEYEIRSLVANGSDLLPRDYVIRAEDYGVPQRRHRVILLGIRTDSVSRSPSQLNPRLPGPTVWNALAGMPRVKARVSRTSTDREEQQQWRMAFNQARSFAKAKFHSEQVELRPAADRQLHPQPALIGESRAEDPLLTTWLRAPGLETVPQHAGRRHMSGDLVRYGYLARLAEHGVYPMVTDLPDELKPNHRNVDGARTPFLDRFKVQAWDRPSSTVASHISKDGHYYIHPDPEQMRSLTVREAARLQTFPDDYFFMGNQTQTYHQVGNAVPPYLAKQIAEVVADVLEL